MGRSTSEGIERTFLCGPEVDCADGYLLYWEQIYWILIANGVMILESKPLVSPRPDSRVVEA